MALHVASRLQNERGVRPGLAVTTVALAFAGGCFYSGDLNDRPSAEIVRLTTAPPMRGDEVEFQALVFDPGDQVAVSWRVEACGGDGADEHCDPVAAAGTAPLTIEVTVPVTVGACPATCKPTERLVVHLDVIDSHGAVARPSQRSVVDVGNRAPTITVQRRGR